MQRQGLWGAGREGTQVPGLAMWVGGTLTPTLPPPPTHAPPPSILPPSSWPCTLPRPSVLRPSVLFLPSASAPPPPHHPPHPPTSCPPPKNPPPLPVPYPNKCHSCTPLCPASPPSVPFPHCPPPPKKNPSSISPPLYWYCLVATATDAAGSATGLSWQRCLAPFPDHSCPELFIDPKERTGHGWGGRGRHPPPSFPDTWVL